MLSVCSIPELRSALAPVRRAGARIGLVPTMGALHAGHLSLLTRARTECDAVVLSLFVNPRQFEDSGDLAAYPRDAALDGTRAAAAGVDVLFIPPPEVIYPPGFATTISVGGPAEGLESAHRGSGHFDGVATVVGKLFTIVAPAVAYFGAKDAQQVAVVRRMTRDLDIPTEIAVCPTVREPDGLAMSSRNARLAPAQRTRAGIPYRALLDVRATVAAGERDPAAAADAGRARLTDAGIDVDYLALVDPDTMAPLSELTEQALAVIAVRIGAVRLIDNLPVPVPDSPRTVPLPPRTDTMRWRPARRAPTA